MILLGTAVSISSESIHAAAAPRSHCRSRWWCDAARLSAPVHAGHPPPVGTSQGRQCTGQGRQQRLSGCKTRPAGGDVAHARVWAGGRPALLLPRWWCAAARLSAPVDASHQPMASESQGNPSPGRRRYQWLPGLMVWPAGGDAAHARWARSGAGCLTRCFAALNPCS